MESFRSHLPKIPSVSWLMEKMTALYPDVQPSYLQNFITLHLKRLHLSPQKYDLFRLDKEAFRRAFAALLISDFSELQKGSLKAVINATGIVLHTGLGRAPLNSEITQKLQQAGRYVNLEISLESGKRGQRNDHLSLLLQTLSGAEDGFAVNNNAAAVMLMLNTTARRKEVILSRGEMIEIGGSFRLPEVMKMSGCKLREVGTTNKTHLKDYEDAVSSKTGAILLCHTSNYEIKGFTAKPELAELVNLAAQKQIPLIYDLGSGAFEKLLPAAADQEPLVSDIVAAGVDLLSFSGDKLLGGAQAGLIVGKEKWVKKCAKNHLLRALRLDKVMIAGLQQTLISHLNNKVDLSGPLMLNQDRRALRQRCENFVSSISDKKAGALNIIDSFGKVGSGAYPVYKLPSVAIQIKIPGKNASLLSRQLRRNDPPIFGYISDDVFHLDLRTVSAADEQILIKALERLL